jgi:hypothetical protein
MSRLLPLALTTFGLLASAGAQFAFSADTPLPTDPSVAPAEVDALSALASRAPAGPPVPSVGEAYTQEVFQLIESGAVKSGADLFKAASLPLWSTNQYRVARVRYELLLAAAALDHAESAKQLPTRWDQLLQALGRPYRIDKAGASRTNPSYYQLDAAATAILALFRDPAAARLAANTATDNGEVQQIVDADQAVRKQDWSKLTPEDHKKIREGDQARETRIREILTQGDLHTAKDFSRAALVMQHSSGFGGYQLAHELAVCATLLGDRSTGRWLVAATYDRMLRSVGQDQRFGTQYSSFGAGPSVLCRIDESGISDTERVALGCPTLEAARNRKL